MAKQGGADEKEVRLLLVDDNAVDRKLLRRMARRVTLPVSIEETGDPDFAMKLLDVEQFDCILIDYEMPQLDGLSLMRELKRRLGGGRPPVLMMTGHRYDTLARDALEAGFDDFLIKDALTPDAFERAIRNSLLRRKFAPEARPSFEAKAVLEALKSALAAFKANDETREALAKDERSAAAMKKLEALSAVDLTHDRAAEEPGRA